MAEHLAAKGANIVINYTSESSKDKAEQLAKSLESQHKVHTILAKADMGSEQGPANIVEMIKNHFSADESEKFQIDIIVNNAGVTDETPLANVKIESFDWLYHVNVRGPMLLVQAAIPYLPKDKSGRIVNISSVSSTFGTPGQTLYSGSKAALEGMTRVWARELAANATVNALTPGPVATDMWDAVSEDFKTMARPGQALTPLAQYVEGVDPPEWKTLQEKYSGRWALPSEIADLVGMLCSRESGWMTGCSLSANGGFNFSKA